MTEAEWLACDYPSPMLEALSDQPGRPKFRLLACRWCLSTGVRRGVESQGATEFLAVAERYAAGRASWDELAVAARAVPQARPVSGKSRGWSSDPVRLDRNAQALRTVAALAADDPWEAAWGVAREGVNLLGPDACDLIRELFGNPFRPVTVDPSWLSWNDGAIPKIAQVIDDERGFGDLPILADALEEAGRSDPELLAHCRRPGEHVRGCWAIDLLLGKA